MFCHAGKLHVVRHVLFVTDQGRNEWQTEVSGIEKCFYFKKNKTDLSKFCPVGWARVRYLANLESESPRWARGEEISRQK